MDYYENALLDLINLEEKLGSDAVDVKAGDQDCNDVIEEHLTDLRDIIAEFRKHHESLVVMTHCIQKLHEVRL